MGEAATYVSGDAFFGINNTFDPNQGSKIDELQRFINTIISEQQPSYFQKSHSANIVDRVSRFPSVIHSNTKLIIEGVSLAMLDKQLLKYLFVIGLEADEQIIKERFIKQFSKQKNCRSTLHEEYEKQRTYEESSINKIRHYIDLKWSPK